MFNIYVVGILEINDVLNNHLLLRRRLSDESVAPFFVSLRTKHLTFIRGVSSPSLTLRTYFNQAVKLLLWFFSRCSLRGAQELFFPHLLRY